MPDTSSPALPASGGQWKGRAQALETAEWTGS
jgi:hypothetical protein